MTRQSVPLPSFVYRAYAEDGALLYVGITDNPKLRIAQHRSDKSWWDTEVTRVDVQMFTNRAEAQWMEQHELTNGKPRYNQSGTPGYKPRPSSESRSASKAPLRPGVPAYEINVRRGPTYWIVNVPEVDRYTQARHLREVEPMARDLIVAMQDVAADSFDLITNIEMPGDAAEHLAMSKKLFAEADEARAEAAAAIRRAARTLRDAGLPLRDIGTLLDVSYQRAGQLVS